LYKAQFYDEALTQVFNAEKNTSENALIAFYKCSILFAAGKSTRALLTLENALEKFPGKLKYLLELNPALLQNQQVVDLISKAKRNNSSR
jgi:predicted Zn-dependent protease